MNFKEELKKINIDLNPAMEEKFEIYYNYLIEVNSYMNLTAITEKKDVYNKHFLDSLQINSLIEKDKEVTLVDVGSGAGFPGIPLAIVNPNLKVTIIDSLNKRIVFLNDLIKKLNLDNVVALHYRAEDYAKECISLFNIVTARAVARLNVLSELCMPLARIDGLFIAMKGSNGKEELEEARNAIGILGGKVLDTIEVELPDEAGKREIIVVKKVKETPSLYPRQFSKIKEKPL